MTTWNKTQALDFAQASAETAFDDWKPYGSLLGSVCAHRINVVDTLREYQAAAHVSAALALFDEQITVTLK